MATSDLLPKAQTRLITFLSITGHHCRTAYRFHRPNPSEEGTADDFLCQIERGALQLDEQPFPFGLQGFKVMSNGAEVENALLRLQLLPHVFDLRTRNFGIAEE